MIYLQTHTCISCSRSIVVSFKSQKQRLFYNEKKKHYTAIILLDCSPDVQPTFAAVLRCLTVFQCPSSFKKLTNVISMQKADCPQVGPTRYRTAIICDQKDFGTVGSAVVISNSNSPSRQVSRNAQGDTGVLVLAEVFICECVCMYVLSSRNSGARTSREQ